MTAGSEPRVGRDLEALAVELKEAVDILEMVAAIPASDTVRERSTRALSRVRGLMEEICAAARGAAGERGRRGGEGTGASVSGDHEGERERREGGLRRCLAQCERAGKALASQAFDVGDAEEAMLLEKSMRELRRAAEAVRLASALKEARASLGLSQRAAAERMDISPAYLSRLERADCNPPSARTMRRIAAFLEGAGGVELKAGRPARERGRETPPGRGVSGEGEAPSSLPRPGGGAVDAGEEGARERDGEDSRSGGAGGEGGSRERAMFPGTEADAAARPSDERACLLRDLLEQALHLEAEELRMLYELARRLRGRGTGRG